jgi:hypothetical protein
MNFDERLDAGRVAESCIARWMMRSGFSIIPAYEVVVGSKNGPQLFTNSGSFAIPDLLAFRDGDPAMFVEAKCKKGFTWSRLYSRFETGINIKSYRDYQSIRAITNMPVWILFLQNGDAVKDAPEGMQDSPRGLFGQELEHLRTRVSHCHGNWGTSGMVYWSPSYPTDDPALHLIAEYDDVVEDHTKIPFASPSAPQVVFEHG